MARVAVLGATGYTGVELVRLLTGHPAVELVALSCRQDVGAEMAAVYPNLRGYNSLLLSEQNAEEAVREAEVLFLALPHGHAGEVARTALRAGRQVIDLGADFRFNSTETYGLWYKLPHPAPELQGQAVYGLPELHREQIKGAALVANPGCYPTGAILALAPALRAGLVEPRGLVIDSKSGVSGAGRGLSLGSLFAEVNESTHAYGVAGHRHTPEIEQELSLQAGEELCVTFTPHLLPMTRGILTTAYAVAREGVDGARMRQAYEEFYSGEPFVEVLPEGQWPRTKWVYGSNHCQLNLTMDGRTGRLIVVSAIDNLVKGASGQAIQNLNILLGLPETTGLLRPGIYP